MDPKYLREWRRLRDRVNALAASSSNLDGYLDLDVPLQGDVSGEGPSTQGDVSGEGPSTQGNVSGEGPFTQGDVSGECPSLIVDEEDPSNLDYGYKETADSSDSNTEIDSSDCDDTPSLHTDLAEWATTTSQTHAALNALLGILRTHGHTLPKDSRTLLQTPSGFEIKNICGGQYTYHGLEPGILQFLTQNTWFTSSVDLTINIDGLPIFKSSKTHFWPILAKFSTFDPFLVALYYGNSKPDPVHDYLHDLIAELQVLMENGVPHKTTVHKVTLRAFICDAPARAFLKCIKGHNALHGCERCLSVATSVEGRVVHLNKVSCEKITDDKFSQLQYPNHQKEPTPLAQLGIKCVTQFPLDHMHLIFLGAVKRLLTFLLRGPDICRLKKEQSEKINNKLVQLKGAMPAEFARQPRSLTELDRWKATELRQFLLYTGPLVLQDVLSQDHCHHFLSLTIGMSILLDDDDARREHYLVYAQNLLEHFVDTCSELYGETFPTYNIHSIKHIADDVFNFKCSLNELSCFPFENHLQSIKKMVRNSKNPVAQVSKRLAEKANTGEYMKQLKRKPYSISAKAPNHCFLLETEQIVFVREKRQDGMLVVDVIDPKFTMQLFDLPCESKLINIIYVMDNDISRAKRKLLKAKHLQRKAVCLPHAQGFAIFPLLHVFKMN